MIEAPIPDNESERQHAVEQYHILDTLPEGSYNDITSLMAMVCDVPVSLVSFIDNNRQWLKSHHGLDFNETSRALSMCGHALVSGLDIFIVEDTSKDERFADNPIIIEYGIVGYAGIPLIDKDGYALGTLCVINNNPMILDEPKKEALKSMARQVLYLLERHQNENRLKESMKDLKYSNDELKRYAAVLSHDIKSPINHILGFVNIIEEDVELDSDALEHFSAIKDASNTLKTYINGLLEYYTSDKLLGNDPEVFNIKDIFDDVGKLMMSCDDTTVTFEDTEEHIYSHKAAISQILLNLVTNSIKYGNEHHHTHVNISFTKTNKELRFAVIDNGIGIGDDDQLSIFELFTTIDPSSKKGTGIGLATVAKLLENLDGSIEVDSTLGKGSTFTFVLPRIDSYLGKLLS